MSPFAEGIRQHDTHSILTQTAGPRDIPFASLGLDAIVVPASRLAAHLDHAVTLARAAGCWLLILCSGRLDSTEAVNFLAARSYHKAVAIDLPRDYSHKLLCFPELAAVSSELPKACDLFTTDLSMKRNIGLVLARMQGWRRIFFLDDDIRDIAYPDLQRTVDMLGSFSAAGLWVTDFPDNSIVCHANRYTGGSQGVFVSGAALAVDCESDIGFFPDIYNEDWLFMFDYASAGKLANSSLQATQLCYYPFAKAGRAAWQEFGDVIAEGLYTLLHLGLDVAHATRAYWGDFLEARRSFLEAILTRLPHAYPEMRDEIQMSVQQAEKCLQTIKPDLCERYVQAWRYDLADWKQRTAAIAVVPSRPPGPRSGCRATARYNRLVRGSAGTRTRARRRSDHRDRAHPAQDRLPGPQERDAVQESGARTSTRGWSPPSRSMPGWSASCKALPRLHRHRHRQTAGGRITSRRPASPVRLRARVARVPSGRCGRARSA